MAYGLNENCGLIKLQAKIDSVESCPYSVAWGSLLNEGKCTNANVQLNLSEKNLSLDAS